MRQVSTRFAWFLVRGSLATLCAVWLWVFLDPMEKLGLVTNVRSFLPVFVVLVVAQLVPYRLVRLLCGIMVSFGYVLTYYSSAHASLGVKLQAFYEMEMQQIHRIFQYGELVDPFQTQLFLWVLCLMYWLIVYASSRTKLWAFYNLLAVVVLCIVDGNTEVHPNDAIVAVLLICTIVLGLVQQAPMVPRRWTPRTARPW